jgi:hypothetical protein
VRHNFRWIVDAAVKWYRLNADCGPNLKLTGKTSAVDICLWSGHYPVTSRHVTARLWRKDGGKFKIQFTDLSQCSARI